MNKWCPTCKQDKDSTEFYADKSRKNDLSYQCKTCTNLKQENYRSIPQNRERAINRSREWYTENKERARQYAKENFDLAVYRDREFRRKYGITLDDYEILVEQQNAECQICTDSSKQLVVDHDHNTGKVRGLLCAKCNAGLGMFQDDSKLLIQAAKYLEKQDG